MTERSQELCGLLTECIQSRQTEMIREQASFTILTSLALFAVSALPSPIVLFFLFSLSLSSLLTLFSLLLLQAWADAFRSSPDLTGVVQIYEELKRKGIEFPMSDLETLSPIHTPQRVGVIVISSLNMYRSFCAKTKHSVFVFTCSYVDYFFLCCF